MNQLGNIVGLMLVVLLCCSSLFLESTAYPADILSNPVHYKRYLRHRPSPKNPELEIYEVKEIYVVRRPTPRPKVIKRLNDRDMEERIRCDFEPTLPECTKLNTYPPIGWRTEKSSSTTTPKPVSVVPSSTEPTSTTTTTELLFLPELSTEAEESFESTTVPHQDKDYEVPDEAYDADVDDEEDKEDVLDDGSEYFNPSGSIGGNDVTE